MPTADRTAREGLREALTLRDTLNREPVKLGDGVTPQQVIALALATIDLGYRVGGGNGRANMLAVEADWIMQQRAKTEAWAKDEQAKRHAAEDKLVDARSSIARLTAEVEALRAAQSVSDDALGTEAESQRIIGILASLNGKNAWDALLNGKVDWGVVRQLWRDKLIAGDKTSLGHCTNMHLTEAGQTLTRTDQPEGTGSPAAAQEGSA